MKKFAVAAAAALTAGVFGLAAIAQDASESDWAKADANNDGFVTYEEALGVYSTLSQAIFDQADANDDGNLDEAEFTSLQGLTAGLDGTTTDNTSSAVSGEASSSSSEASTSSSSAM